MSNNYIEVDKNTFSNKISFIANYAQLLNPVTLIIEKGGIYGNTGSNYLVKEIKEGNKMEISYLEVLARESIHYIFHSEVIVVMELIDVG